MKIYLLPESYIIEKVMCLKKIQNWNGSVGKTGGGLRKIPKEMLELFQKLLSRWIISFC